jgi:hypothetical protein
LRGLPIVQEADTLGVLVALKLTPLFAYRKTMVKFHDAPPSVVRDISKALKTITHVSPPRFL